MFGPEFSPLASVSDAIVRLRYTTSGPCVEETASRSICKTYLINRLAGKGGVQVLL